MPWLPFYASIDDLPLVEGALMSDGDVALLVPQGGNRWRAVLGQCPTADGRYPLWHVPSGRLPLLSPGIDDAVAEIDDPFEGWTQLRTSDGEPFFGNYPGIFWLNLRVAPKEAGRSIGLSSVEWIGNYFWALGRKAPDATKMRWDRLRRQFARLGPKVPRAGLASGRKPEIFALPAALERLEAGALADMSPR